MIYMKSTNANDGTMVIDVSFTVGTDPDMNTVLTQNRVSAATAKLPESVKKYGVTNIVLACGYKHELLKEHLLLIVQKFLIVDNLTYRWNRLWRNFH